MKRCIYCKQGNARKYIGWAWAHQRCIDVLRAMLRANTVRTNDVR